MMIKEIKIEDKNKWDDFLLKNNGCFTQSLWWGDFQKGFKEKVYRFFIKEDNEVIGLFQVFKIKLKGSWSVLECSYGPVLNLEKFKLDNFKEVDIFLKDLAKKENALLVQIEPRFLDLKFKQNLELLNFKKTKKDQQPKETLILDLKKTEEELLKQMKSKTRYNLKLAHKKGVEVFVDNSLVDEFLRLNKITMQRDKFISHSNKKYFQGLLENKNVKLFLAKHENNIIAANIVVFDGQTVTYLFGASDNQFRNVMAPYLLQWKIIKVSKNLGFKYYDFWGASEVNKRWKGVTRFKKGFSPEKEFTEFLGTYEKVYQPFKLFIYRFLQKIKKIIGI